MTQPYFSIGEEVILISIDNPRLNGEYTIERYMPPQPCINPLTGRLNTSTNHAYKLHGIEPEDTTKGSGYFRQSSLRKKHRPSDESFSELMANYRTVKVRP